MEIPAPGSCLVTEERSDERPVKPENNNRMFIRFPDYISELPSCPYFA
jgi:hypothetical protein